MKIFIAGIGGFLGSRLAAHCRSDGHAVSGSSHRSLEPMPGICVSQLSLAGGIPLEALANHDLVIHCTYVRKATVSENVESAKRLHQAAGDAGVPWQIFLSSYSARPNATTDYGRIKYELECFFLDRGDTIIRPGLVVGEGGLFAHYVRQMRRFPVVPLLDGGESRLPVIAINDFLCAMGLAIDDRIKGAVNLFDPELMTMRRLAELIAHASRRRFIPVNIPDAWAEWMLVACRRLGLSLPVDLDNIRALKQNQSIIHESDLPQLLEIPLSTEAAIQAVVPKIQ
jgi:NADH dehydrogenase